MVDNNVENIINNIAKNIYDKYSYIIEKRYSDWDIDYYNDISFGNMVVVFEDNPEWDYRKKIHIGLPEYKIEEYYILFNDSVLQNNTFDYKGDFTSTIIDFAPIIETLKKVKFWSEDDVDVKCICYAAFLLAHEFGHILDSVIYARRKYLSEHELQDYPELRIDLEVSEDYDTCDDRWFMETSIFIQEIRGLIVDDYFFNQVSEEATLDKVKKLDYFYRENRHELIPDILAIQILNSFDSLKLLTS